jgi:uncharacterized protein (UPF0332 family)
MSLENLLQKGKLIEHVTSKQEIENVLQMVDRDIVDSKIPEVSPDRKFAIAYNAVLTLATVILYCKGYRTRGESHHFVTFQAMKFILGKKYTHLADYFDDCRSKRNMVDYDHAGRISDKDAKELIDEAEKFKETIIVWLQKNYPTLYSS